MPKEDVNTKVPIPNVALKRAIRISFDKQRQAALVMGCSESYLSSILNGWQKPTSRFIRQACSVFQKSAEELGFSDLGEQG